jgi:bifunctional non-homologous end joining protein LigD
VRGVSRKGNSFKSCPDLCAAVARLGVENAILDGEIVCLDEQGKADFNSLLFRRRAPFYHAFDLLWHDGYDLRQHTLIERKDILRGLLNGCPHEIRYVEHLPGEDGAAFFDVCCRHDLEGVVAKRRESTYLDGDHKSAWVKIKNQSYSRIMDRDKFFESKPRAQAQAARK